MPRFSANLGFLWPDLPLLGRIDAAAAAGFRAIELHWPYDVPPAEVRDACARHGLTLLALNTPLGGSGDFGLASVPGREGEFREGFAAAAAYARAAGAGAIHVMAGRIGPAGREAAESVFLANLAWAGSEAPDLTLLLEPINRIDQPAYFYATIPEGAGMVERLALPNAGLMFDAYHVGMGGADPVAVLEAHLPLVRHVQIAAVPSRAEPDEGEVDYAAFFAALDRLGYRGWVGAEYKPRAGTDEGLAWRGELGVTL